MIGLYIDDGVTGVGTLTFYEPHSKKYGALGHMITAPNGRSKIMVEEGRIVKADISGIHQSSKGLPGEKLGTFFSNHDVIGEIEFNNRFGIYGNLINPISNTFFPTPIPVATALEVKEGPAKIYTVIKGGSIQEFEVTIEKVFKQYHPHEKGLIVKINDYDLLKKTGGIVQGMSGSPIVQKGKLAGAVTHVFIDDSTRGYGILAEWMIKEAGLVKEKVAKNRGINLN
jgi:stage IV sporulation protein B